jgi:zinc finger HIT domain-containing protein 1
MRHLYATKSAQQDRLAQLSDDNAFVDVEAALKRMGEDASQEALAPQQRTAKTPASSSPSSALDVAGRTGGAPGQRVYASRGSRASQDALLNGARVPLTASLLEQHKLYIESVRAAAEAVAKRSDDDSDTENNNSDGGGVGGRGARPRSSAQQRRGTRQLWGRAVKAAPESFVVSVASHEPMTDPVVVASVRTVKKENAESSVLFRTGKQSRDSEEMDSVKKEKLELSDGCTAGRLPHAEAAEASGVAVPSTLVAKLHTELCLVEQWRRAMLHHPPQIINGVLSPETRPPWKSSATTEADAKDNSKKRNASGTHGDGVDGESYHASVGEQLLSKTEEEEVLPYPLLQLYTLCPSYDALTAAPVSRRQLERMMCSTVTSDDSDVTVGATNETSAVATPYAACRSGGQLLSSAPVRVSSSRLKNNAPSLATPTEASGTITVAGVAFSVPLTRRSSRTPEEGSDATFRPARWIDYPGSNSVTGETTRNGEGVQGTHQHHLCSVCMLPAAYRCARCRVALFCSIECHVMHDATRCLKFTA